MISSPYQRSNRIRLLVTGGGGRISCKQLVTIDLMAAVRLSGGASIGTGVSSQKVFSPLNLL